MLRRLDDIRQEMWPKLPVARRGCNLIYSTKIGLAEAAAVP